MLLEIIVALILILLGFASIQSTFERSMNFASKIPSRLIPQTFVCLKKQTRRPYNLQECKTEDDKNSQLIITRDDLGLSLIEILVGTALATILMTLLLKTFALVSLESKTLNDWIREDSASDRIEVEITRLFEASDTHTLPISPRIHFGGQIELLNGENNSIMNANLKLKPASNSMAFSNSKLEMRLLADIRNCKAAGLSRTGSACLRYADTASTNDYQSFIMISIDGIFEGQGKFTGLGKCKDFSITLGESMLFASPTLSNNCTERIIIPLDFIQTIYQSQAGDFRLISHRTNINVENQPLSILMPKMQITLSLKNKISPWQLEIQISKRNKMIKRSLIINKLPKESSENLIFNYL